MLEDFGGLDQFNKIQNSFNVFIILSKLKNVLW